MDPDGSDVARLMVVWPYQVAAAQEIRSAGGRFTFFVREDASGPQIFYHDVQFNAGRQVTVMGAGA